MKNPIPPIFPILLIGLSPVIALAERAKAVQESFEQRQGLNPVVYPRCGGSKVKAKARVSPHFQSISENLSILVRRA